MKTSQEVSINNRVRLIGLLIGLFSLVTLGRLFYWQVVSSKSLKALAVDQRSQTRLLQGSRGNVLTSDGFSLASNQTKYLLYGYKPQFKQSIQEVVNRVAPLLLEEPKTATEAAKPWQTRVAEKQIFLTEQLNKPTKWISLQKGLTLAQKESIAQLGVIGLGFDTYEERFYPEASMSAHLLGFVGRNDQGEPQGYFGLEGFYNVELQGRDGSILEELDATGKPILIGEYDQKQSRPGRDLKLHLNRTIQFLVESRLKQGLERYQAASGEVILMDPHTGGIIAMAALPSYSPSKFIEYEPKLYKNPIVADIYEPGSTFKVVVMAGGIDAGVIAPTSQCGGECNGPVNIDKYTIRTWNDKYFPNQTMEEVLERSDNTGMIYVARQLGKEKFLKTIDAFGFNKGTGIDLQEEVTPRHKQKWSDIDIATASFGQGIAVTGIQMVQAVAVIANGGNLVTPQVVASVHTDKSIPIQTKTIPHIIKKETADLVTEMMIKAAYHGEAKWAVLKDYDVAGKTGTAQIPISGHYDENRTIASFIGFAPAHDPKFVMLVKLTEPKSSPWAAETAAPLWYNIAKEVLVSLGVPPNSAE